MGIEKPTEVLLDYWRAGRPVQNLGDYVTVVLLHLFGYKTLPYREVQHSRRITDFATCLFGAGTILDYDWCRRVRMTKSVWGSGDWGDPRLTPEQIASCRFHSVRGPLTVKRLALPENTPLGDPALLLPLLAPLERRADIGVLYVPHFHARHSISKDVLHSFGASSLMCTAFRPTEFWDRLQTLRDAHFVLTGSLHGAIFAHAYGRPWALCLPDGQKLNKPGKWDDWFAYLGMRRAVCRNYDESHRWWSRSAKYAAGRDLRPMVRSFPFAIPSLYARQCLAFAYV